MVEYIQNTDWYKELSRKESLAYRKRVDDILINALFPDSIEAKRSQIPFLLLELEQ